MTLFASSTFSSSGNVFLQDLLLFVCIYATIYTAWHMCGDASGGREETLDYLDVEILVVETRRT